MSKGEKAPRGAIKTGFNDAQRGVTKRGQRLRGKNKGRDAVSRGQSQGRNGRQQMQTHTRKSELYKVSCLCYLFCNFVSKGYLL